MCVHPLFSNSVVPVDSVRPVSSSSKFFRRRWRRPRVKAWFKVWLLCVVVSSLSLFSFPLSTAGGLDKSQAPSYLFDNRTLFVQLGVMAFDPNANTMTLSWSIQDDSCTWVGGNPNNISEDAVAVRESCPVVSIFFDTCVPYVCMSEHF